MRRALYAFLAVVCLLPSGVLAWHYRAMPQLGWLDDDGVYAVTARALAAGHGYVLDHLPAAPPQTKYPPLYPVCLALFWRGGMPAMMAAQWVLLPACTALSWLWWRRLGFANWVCLVLGAALVLNPFSITLSTSLMSELLFSCLLLACVLSDRRPILAGMLGGLAYGTRLVAMPLLAAVPLVLWLRNDRRGAVCFVLTMTPFMGAWHIWCALHRSYSPDPVSLYYTDYLRLWLANVSWSDALSLIGTNAAALLTALSGLFTFSGGDTDFTALLFRLFAFAAISGSVRLLKNGPDSMILYGAGLLAMLVVWNYPPNERFIWPILPLLLAGAAAELIVLGTMLRRAFNSGRRRPAVVISLAVLCLIGANLHRNVSAFASAVPAALAAEERRTPERLRTAAWMHRNLPSKATVAAWNGAQVYLDTSMRGYTPRVPTRLFYSGDRVAFSGYFSRLTEFSRENRLSYILVTPDDFRMHLTPIEAAAVKSGLAARPDLTRLYDSSGYVVYRVEAR
jgi:hypothetical protein